MIVKTEYDLGDLVYLKSDNEQNEYIITGITIRDTGLCYELSLGQYSSWHYRFEISIEKNTVKMFE